MLCPVHVVFSPQPVWILVRKHRQYFFPFFFFLSSVFSEINHCVNTQSSESQHYVLFRDRTFKELTGFRLKWMCTVSGVLECQEQTSPILHRWKPSELRYTTGGWVCAEWNQSVQWKKREDNLMLERSLLKPHYGYCLFSDGDAVLWEVRWVNEIESTVMTFNVRRCSELASYLWEIRKTQPTFSKQIWD